MAWSREFQVPDDTSWYTPGAVMRPGEQRIDVFYIEDVTNHLKKIDGMFNDWQVNNIVDSNKNIVISVNPSVAPVRSGNTILLYYNGPNNHLHEINFDFDPMTNMTKWSNPFENLGPFSLTFNPTGASGGNNPVDLFYRSGQPGNNQLFWIWWNGNWSGEQPLQGILQESPSGSVMGTW